MLQIAICDDNATLVTALEQMILAQSEPLCITIFCDVFYDGCELVQALSKQRHYDLILLDIEMQQMDGIAVGQYLRQFCHDNTTQIVYISAQASYAMELFQNRPMDFLIKPITEEDLNRILTVAMQLTRATQEKLLSFSADGQFYKIPHHQILYFSSSGHKVFIHTTQGKISLYGKLSDWMAQVADTDFLLIHKSYFVNDAHITLARYDSVTLTDGTTLPISQAQRKIVRTFFYEKNTTPPPRGRNLCKPS